MDFQTWPVIEADNVTAESASILTALAVASQRSRRGMNMQYEIPAVCWDNTDDRLSW